MKTTRYAVMIDGDYVEIHIDAVDVDDARTQYLAQIAKRVHVIKLKDLLSGKTAPATSNAAVAQVMADAKAIREERDFYLAKGKTAAPVNLIDVVHAIYHEIETELNQDEDHADIVHEHVLQMIQAAGFAPMAAPNAMTLLGSVPPAPGSTPGNPMFPPNAHFSCPYCPISGITTEDDYKKHLATHEKPAARYDKKGSCSVAAFPSLKKPATPAPGHEFCGQIVSGFPVKPSCECQKPAAPAKKGDKKQ